MLSFLFPSIPMLSSEPTPAYPSATSVPQDSEGTIVLPGLSDESENFQLAVEDSATELIDTPAVMAAAAEILADTGLKVALAVDQEPITVASVDQLIRGMLLFGPIDALSDDWLENAKTRGYVAKDWVVIGIILPESGRGDTRVGIDLGRNLSVPDDRLVTVGLDDFAAGNTTAAVISTLESVVAGVEREPDYARYALWVLGGLVVLLGGSGTVKALSKRRSERETAQLAQAENAAAQIRVLAQRIEGVGYQPWQSTGNGPAAQALGALARTGPQLVAAARTAAGPEDSNPSPTQAPRLTEHAATLGQLQEILDELDSWNRPAKLAQSLRRMQENHREQLAEIPPLLAADTRGRIDNAQAIRVLVVEHTDELQVLRTATVTADSGEELLERHWKLRHELANELRTAPALAKLPGTSTADIFGRLNGLLEATAKA